VRINEAFGLLNIVYIDWSSILANPRGIRKNSLITWDNFAPQVLKQPIMVSDVVELFDQGQYTFQVSLDGSLIQIYYEYDIKGNQLLAARLAFYSAVSFASEKRMDLFADNSNLSAETDLDNVEEDLEDSYLQPQNETAEELQVPPFNNAPISWLRIDYDPKHAKGVLHHDCHMHLSAFPDARLVVAGVPTPTQFVEFVMALCYPKDYEKHRLDEQGRYKSEKHIIKVNSGCVPTKEHDTFRYISHIRIPIHFEGRG
jgi:hypothetical protein